MKFDANVQGSSAEHEASSDVFAPLGAASIDIGSRNFFCAYVELHVVEGTDGREVRFETTALEGIDLKEGNTHASIEEIVNNLFVKLSNALDKLNWLFDLPCNVPILVERQVDHIRDFGNAENYAIYSALMALLLARQKQELLLPVSTPLPKSLVCESLGEKLRFTPRSGGQKHGLKEDRGGARKERTGDVALALLGRHGNTDAANFMMDLSKPKPYEDCGDVILQAVHYLMQHHKERLDKHVRHLGFKGKQRHAKTELREFDVGSADVNYVDLRGEEAAASAKRPRNPTPQASRKRPARPTKQRKQ